MTKTTFGKMVLSVLGALAVAACSSGGGGGGGGGGGTASGITINGTLGTSNASVMSVPDEDQLVGQLAISPSDLKLYGIAFTNPPVVNTVEVNADGTFSLSLPGVPDGTAISLIFQDKTSGQQVGLVKFEDTTKKDLNGNNKKDTSIALKGTVTLGNLNLADGEVTVQVSNIQSSVDTTTVATSELFQPTGSWSLGPLDFDPPEGYVADPFGTGDMQQGEVVTIVRYDGKDFTPSGAGCQIDSATGERTGNCGEGDGNIGTTDVFGGQVWGGPASGSGSGVSACGYKFGATLDDARAFAHINLTASGMPTVGGHQMAAGAFVFNAPGGWGTRAAPYNKPWIKDGASASHAYRKCFPVEKQGTDGRTYRFYSCEVHATVNSASVTRYHAFQMEGGGCFDSQNQPVRVDQSFWDGNPTPAHCDPFTIPVSGFAGSACTYSNAHPYTGAPAQTLVCRGMDGRFTDQNLTASASSENWGNSETQVNFVDQGDPCHAAGNGSDAAILAGYQCFSDYYNNHRQEWDGMNCGNDFRFNWAANHAYDFETGGSRGRPKQLYMFNLLTYAPNGKTFYLEDTDEETETMMISGAPVLCRIDHQTKLQATKKDATKMIIDLTQGGILKTKDANCLGAMAKEDGNIAKRIKTKRIMIYGTKQ